MLKQSGIPRNRYNLQWTSMTRRTCKTNPFSSPWLPAELSDVKERSGLEAMVSSLRCSRSTIIPACGLSLVDRSLWRLEWSLLLLPWALWGAGREAWWAMWNLLFSAVWWPRWSWGLGIEELNILNALCWSPAKALTRVCTIENQSSSSWLIRIKANIFLNNWYIHFCNEITKISLTHQLSLKLIKALLAGDVGS